MLLELRWSTADADRAEAGPRLTRDLEAGVPGAPDDAVVVPRCKAADAGLGALTRVVLVLVLPRIASRLADRASTRGGARPEADDDADVDDARKGAAASAMVSAPFDRPLLMLWSDGVRNGVLAPLVTAGTAFGDPGGDLLGCTAAGPVPPLPAVNECCFCADGTSSLPRMVDAEAEVEDEGAEMSFAVADAGLTRFIAPRPAIILAASCGGGGGAGSCACRPLVAPAVDDDDAAPMPPLPRAVDVAADSTDEPDKDGVRGRSMPAAGDAANTDDVNEDAREGVSRVAVGRTGVWAAGLRSPGPGPVPLPPVACAPRLVKPSALAGLRGRVDDDVDVAAVATMDRPPRPVMDDNVLLAALPRLDTDGRRRGTGMRLDNPLELGKPLPKPAADAMVPRPAAARGVATVGLALLFATERGGSEDARSLLLLLLLLRAVVGVAAPENVPLPRCPAWLFCLPSTATGLATFTVTPRATSTPGEDR